MSSEVKASMGVGAPASAPGDAQMAPVSILSLAADEGAELLAGHGGMLAPYSIMDVAILTFGTAASCRRLLRRLGVVHLQSSRPRGAELDELLNQRDAA
jgi:hypothetical protein